MLTSNLYFLVWMNSRYIWMYISKEFATSIKKKNFLKRRPTLVRNSEIKDAINFGCGLPLKMHAESFLMNPFTFSLF